MKDIMNHQNFEEDHGHNIIENGLRYRSLFYLSINMITKNRRTAI